RQTGKVPAVLYGGKGQSITLAVNAKQVSAILRSETGHNTLFQVDLGGKHQPAILKGWLTDPITGKLPHADRLRVAMHVRMRAKKAPKRKPSPRRRRAKKATRAKRKSNARPAICGRLEKRLCGSLWDLGIPIRSISGRRITWVSWRWMNSRIVAGFAWNGPRARRWWAAEKLPEKK